MLWTDYSTIYRVGKERENLMDPIGQFYLPGYFCPAALIDSRETTRDTERDRDNRDYCFLNYQGESNTKITCVKKIVQN